jgi:hypothetical protein
MKSNCHWAHPGTAPGDEPVEASERRLQPAAAWFGVPAGHRKPLEAEWSGFLPKAAALSLQGTQFRFLQ